MLLRPTIVFTLLIVTCTNFAHETTRRDFQRSRQLALAQAEATAEDPDKLRQFPQCELLIDIVDAEAPYIAVIGNNAAMNQIRYGQIAKYGEQRGNIGNKLGEVPFSKFAEMLGGYGEEVTDCAEVQPALQRAREAVRSDGKSAVINIWVDPNEYAPGTKAQTMYK